MTLALALNLLPFMILVGGAFLIYLICAFAKLGNKTEAILTSLILVLAIGSLFMQGSILMKGRLTNAWNDVLLVVPEFNLTASLLGVFVVSAACVVGIFICIYSAEYLSQDPRSLLYYPLILLLFAGLLGMFYVRDLFSLFILAELTTITASGLTAFRFDQAAAVKAGYKYLVMSSLGTLVMMLGVYFIYRDTGMLDLDQLAGVQSNFMTIGGACFALGFSIKAGVVPLHAWVPEVYANAPSAVSGLFASVTSKAMLFILPGVSLKLNILAEELGLFLLIFSAANMLVGVLRMLTQQNLRRLLAFSAITHTGYLMFILSIYFIFDLPDALAAALFSFLSIALMKAMAFLCVGVYEYRLQVKTIPMLNGAFQRMPFNAVCFSIAVAGLAGIPLFAGFVGKWLIYSAAVSTRDPLVLAGFAVFLVCSIIALVSYLSALIRQFQPAEEDVQVKEEPISLWMKVPVGVLAVSVVVLGILPSAALDGIIQLVERIGFS